MPPRRVSAGEIDLNIVFEPDFVSNSEALFHELVTRVNWDERMRARKTASFGRPYNYSGMEYSAAPFPTILLPVLDRLEVRIGFRPDSCLLNLYESGRSTMGFHSDSNDDLTPGSGVSIISLGWPRMIVFRAKRNKGLEHRMTLSSGSLLYMAPEIQDNWRHAIPAEQVAGPRMSLTFRLLK